METLIKTPATPTIPEVGRKLKVTRVEIVHSRKYVFGIVVVEHIFTYTVILQRRGRKYSGFLTTERHAAYCILSDVLNKTHISEDFDLSLLDDKKANFLL